LLWINKSKLLLLFACSTRIPSICISNAVPVFIFVVNFEKELNTIRTMINTVRVLIKKVGI
jgi:hypothetical protein